MFIKNLGPVVRSLLSANRWLRGIKTYSFPWYLTLVSANHASSNPDLISKSSHTLRPDKFVSKLFSFMISPCNCIFSVFTYHLLFNHNNVISNCKTQTNFLKQYNKSNY